MIINYGKISIIKLQLVYTAVMKREVRLVRIIGNTLKFIFLVRLHLVIASRWRRKKLFSVSYGLSLADSETSLLSKYGKQVFIFSFRQIIPKLI